MQHPSNENPPPWSAAVIDHQVDVAPEDIEAFLQALEDGWLPHVVGEGALVVHATLDLRGRNIRSLPSQTTVMGDLLGQGSLLEALPDGLHLVGDLRLNDAVRFTFIGSGVVINGDADFRGCRRLRALPSDMAIGRVLRTRRSGVEAVPEGLQAKGGQDTSAARTLSGRPSGKGLRGWLDRQAGRALAIDQIRENKSFIKSSFEALRGRRRRQPETFEEAVARTGASDERVRRAGIVITVFAWCFLLLTLAVLGGGLALFQVVLQESADTGRAVDLLRGTSLLVVLPVPAALTFRWSFRSWQIRARRLGTVREWLSQPGEWLPRI